MGKIKVYYNKRDGVLTVWMDNPKKEAFADEVADDFIVLKDKDGNTIGFEKFNYKMGKNISDDKYTPEFQVM